jgi:ethanolamine ammonia-lyase small subunit
MREPSVPENSPFANSEVLRVIRARTPARIFAGRAGPCYRTSTQLELREAHAAALDAVHAEINLQRDFDADFIRRWRMFEVTSRASGKAEYLLRPELGRRLSDAARSEIRLECGSDAARTEPLPERPTGPDVQVVVGDGLSAAAVVRQVPTLLPMLEEETRHRGWSFGRPFLVRYCRVGVLNDVGELLDPAVVVLLIGERPGLATAESLSAYMAYRPRRGDRDAQRNLISNIHGRGVPTRAAAVRILALADKMRATGESGVNVKEDLTTARLSGRD